MAVYCVYHVVHVQTPYRYTAKLFVTDVPGEVRITWDMVDEYDEYSEFGILHANHGIEKITRDSDPALRRAYRANATPSVSYERLIDMMEEEFV